MSIFDQLCNIFEKWRDVSWSEYMAAHVLAIQIEKGFQEYIKAPEQYTVDPAGSAQIRPYIKIVRMDLLDNNKFRPARAKSSLDALQKNDRGNYYFALSVTLEAAPSVWPKQRFPIPLEATITKAKTSVTIAQQKDGTFEFAYDNQALNVTLYQYIVDFLKKGFKNNTAYADMVEVPVGFNPG